MSAQPSISISCSSLYQHYRGEIPDMNTILDRDDITIMKRAIFSTQVRKEKSTRHFPWFLKSACQHFYLLKFISLGLFQIWELEKIFLIFLFILEGGGDVEVRVAFHHVGPRNGAWWLEPSHLPSKIFSYSHRMTLYILLWIVLRTPFLNIMNWQNSFWINIVTRKPVYIIIKRNF